MSRTVRCTDPQLFQPALVQKTEIDLMQSGTKWNCQTPYLTQHHQVAVLHASPVSRKKKKAASKAFRLTNVSSKRQYGANQYSGSGVFARSILCFLYKKKIKYKSQLRHFY